MGLNAQTVVPVFTAGQVLTAAEVTQINTGIPVFATTVTRDAAFGGAGEKTLAQGQYAYIEATSTLQVYTGSAWISANSSGFALIKTQTIGTGVSSVAVTDAFSANYDNYLITIGGGVGSTSDNVALQLGSTTTGYYGSGYQVIYSSATLAPFRQNNATNFNAAGTMSTNNIQFNVTVIGPFLTRNTGVSSPYISTGTASGSGQYSGYLNDSTSYSGFTIIPIGTLTGGTIRVYGYVNS